MTRQQQLAESSRQLISFCLVPAAAAFCQLIYGMVFRNLGMARTILGIADLGPNRLVTIIYNYYDNCQLRVNRYRNDKNSGGLFQFYIC